jgi:hypothetical protein
LSQHSEKKHDQIGELKRNISTAKSAVKLVKEIPTNPQQAFNRALVAGMKLATEHDPIGPDAKISKLTDALKELGLPALSWDPEVLMSELDKKFHGWTQERAAKALAYHNQTGLMDTDVQPLVRNKIYAIRQIATSDIAQNEWNVFEKVGAALNDRIPHFGVTEPMTAQECARAVEVIESIRPDEYSDEVKLYIAACCHTDGIYTVEPIRSLKMVEPFLRKMIQDEEADDPKLKAEITAKFESWRSGSPQPFDPADTVAVQAARLLAISHYAAEGPL